MMVAWWLLLLVAALQNKLNFDQIGSAESQKFLRIVLALLCMNLVWRSIWRALEYDPLD